MALIFQETKRTTLTGSAFEAITFTKPNAKYLVKNTTSGDIYVAFQSDATVDGAMKIFSGKYQICYTGVWSQPPGEETGEFVPYVTNTIYVKGTGEIEIQQV